MTEQTIGERRVGVCFNPSANVDVAEVKRITAGLIDTAHDQFDDATASTQRMRAASIAMTKYEEASMWLVKAITMPEDE